MRDNGVLGDWSASLVGRCFRGGDGTVELVDYDFDATNPVRERLGVLLVGADGRIGGTTIGGYQLRHALALGALVEIPRAEFDARRAVGIPWIEMVTRHDRAER